MVHLQPEHITDSLCARPFANGGIVRRGDHVPGRALKRLRNDRPSPTNCPGESTDVVEQLRELSANLMPSDTKSLRASTCELFFLANRVGTTRLHHQRVVHASCSNTKEPEKKKQKE